MIGYYKNAKALLIPIRDTEQDNARFPNKIAEYSAAKKPIITTNSGVVKRYFNEESAFISKNYCIKEYSSIIDLAIANPEIALKKSIKCYEIGRKHFDINSHSSNLDMFLNDIK